MPFDARTRCSLHHQSLHGEAVDNLSLSVLPRHRAESLRPLAHSQKTCKAPERDSQNSHGDHQDSYTEFRNAYGPISEGFRLILPQSARFAQTLGRILRQDANPRQGRRLVAFVWPGLLVFGRERTSK